MNNIPGLKENWKQFTLLVLINAFVGGMVGMERTILPEIAETDFGIAARSAIILTGMLVLGSALWIMVRMNRLDQPVLAPDKELSE